MYKDQKGVDQELKWIIKVTRSDVNDVANVLLKHEKQVFSRLVSDLINTVKQKSAGFLEGARVSPKDLILTPEFIYEETSHAADVSRHVLVLDNLEEKQFFAMVFNDFFFLSSLSKKHFQNLWCSVGALFFFALICVSWPRR